MIQLRYTKGTLWNIELVKPKSKNYDEIFQDALEYQSSYVQCDWRHLLAYLLGDEEMNKYARDRTKDKPRRNVMSWLFKITHPGVTKELYVALTDAGSDMRSGMLCGKINSATIWNSVVNGVDIYLREKVDNTEPIEYELATRYYSHGVAKRESKGNELWCYTKEEEGRKSYKDKFVVKHILINRD